MKLKEFFDQINKHQYKYTEGDVEDYELKICVKFLETNPIQLINSGYFPITRYEVDSHKEEVRFYFEE